MSKIDLPRRKSAVRGDSTLAPNVDKVIPPSTPPQKSRKPQGKGSLSAPRTRLSNNLRDTFIADQARGTAGGNEHHRKQSSHDLSWPPRQTRDSVMDNMLQSLDQLYVSDSLPRTAPHKSIEPNDSFDLGPYGPNRLRGHTFSSSLSSDRSFRIQDSSPKSSRGARGHRSNSSSNFSSGLTRIDSVRADNKGRAEKEEPASKRERLYESQRALGPEEKAAAAAAASNIRSRKASKSSASSSLDFGQMIHEPRNRRLVHRRSSSFDLADHRRRDAKSSAGEPVRAPIPTSRVPVLGYHDLDAAPTPVVPSGPSRNNSPVRANFPAPTSAATDSRTLTPQDKGSKSASAPRQRPTEKRDERHGKGRNNSKLLPSHFRGPSMDATIPATPTTVEKPRHVSEPKASTPASGQAKERPGFFRRVFGSSRSTLTTVTNESLPLADAVPHSAGSVRRGSSRGATISQSASFSKLAKTATDSSLPFTDPKEPRDLPAMPLNKKSSFFRRRKKSVSEEPPMPVLIPSLEPPNLLDPSPLRDPQPSPVSSLRKVMDPYLSHALSAHPTRKGEVREKEASRTIPPFPQPDFVFAPRVDSLAKLVKVPNLPVEEPKSKNVVATDPQSDVAGSVPLKEESLDATTPATSKPTPIQPSHIGLEKKDNTDGSPNVNNINHFNNHVTDEKLANDHALNSHSTDKKVSLDDEIHTSQSRSATTTTTRTSAVAGATQLSDLSLSNESSGDTMESVMREKGVVLTDWDSPVSTRQGPTKDHGSSKNSSGRSTRIYLQPTASEDHLLNSKSARASLKLANDAAMGSCCSVPSVYLDAHSKVASLVTDEAIDLSATLTKPNEHPELYIESEIVVLDASSNKPTDESIDAPPPPLELSNEDRTLARQIFDGDASAVSQSDAASRLGGLGDEKAKVRVAYMELFNWQNMSILTALRGLCNQLFLKCETQEVDRIIAAFSARWCECNPNHGFKAKGKQPSDKRKRYGLIEILDVVHTICYSIILLNTDLHIADFDKKMTKAEFVKNALPTVRNVAEDATRSESQLAKSSTMPPTKPEHPSPQPRSNSLPVETQPNGGSSEAKRPTHRLSILPSDYSGDLMSNVTSTEHGFLIDCGLLIKTPYHGSANGWEAQIETVLKKFYESIRQQRLPLQGSAEPNTQDGNATSSESVGTLSKASNMLRRTPSMLSKAGSDHQASRPRPAENSSRFGTTRWNPKNRPRPRLNGVTTGNGPSGRSSFDDTSSAMPSPSGNSTWTKHSVNRTQTSMESLATAPPDSKPSIGFANALSQAIIREESTSFGGGSNSVYGANSKNNNDSTTRAVPLLEDESLELAGAPWAKEGLVKHKHYYEATDRRSRNRDWVECFAVVEKGWVKIFSFPSSTSRSLRQRVQRTNQRPAPGSVVGGGNWMDNAEALGEFMLRHTFASALPTPGYSKEKPYVWALSMPSGATHLFAVGTPEIVSEFVATANYWSARLSKEPLVGAISNMEYGWSANVISPIFLAPPPPAAASESTDPATTTAASTLSTSAPARASSTGSIDIRPLSKQSDKKETPGSSQAQAGRPSMQGSIRSSSDHASGIGGSRVRLPGDRAMINEWSPPQASMMASTLLEVDQLRGIRAYLANVNAELAAHGRLKDGILLAVGFASVLSLFMSFSFLLFDHPLPRS